MTRKISSLVLLAVLAVSTLLAERMGTNPKPVRPTQQHSFLSALEFAFLSLFRQKHIAFSAIASKDLRDRAVNGQMHHFAILDNLLWGAGFIGNVALLLVLGIRGRVHTFPIFTSMLAYQAFSTILLFSVSRYCTAHTYFIVYWSLAPGDYVFQIALIFEMARIVLRPTGTWVRDARAAFLIWSTAGALVAVILSLKIDLPGLKGLDLWAARTTMFTSLLTCMVFLAMSAAANRLGLLWTSHVVALGQGLTTWTLTALFGNLVHFAFGWRRHLLLFDHVEMLVYLTALGFWTISFWRGERERPPLSPDMQAYLTALHDRVRREITHTTPGIQLAVQVIELVRH